MKWSDCVLVLKHYYSIIASPDRCDKYYFIISMINSRISNKFRETSNSIYKLEMRGKA